MYYVLSDSYQQHTFWVRCQETILETVHGACLIWEELIIRTNISGEWKVARDSPSSEDSITLF